jgi:hypothetical protein
MAFGLAKLVAAVAMWKFQEWGGYLLAATVTLLLPFDLRQALSTPLGAMSCWPWRTPPGWSYWCSLCEGGCLVGHSSPTQPPIGAASLDVQLIRTLRHQLHRRLARTRLHPHSLRQLRSP